MMNWRRSKNILRTPKRMKSNFWISLSSMSILSVFFSNSPCLLVWSKILYKYYTVPPGFFLLLLWLKTSVSFHVLWLFKIFTMQHRVFFVLDFGENYDLVNLQAQILFCCHWRHICNFFSMTAALMFNVYEWKRALAECVLWWCHTCISAKICVYFEKLQAPTNITEIAWFKVHFFNHNHNILVELNIRQ